MPTGLRDRIAERIRPNVYLIETGPDLSVQEAERIAHHLRDTRGWVVLIEPSRMGRQP
jgi:hypothetical protein